MSWVSNLLRRLPFIGERQSVRFEGQMICVYTKGQLFNHVQIAEVFKIIATVTAAGTLYVNTWLIFLDEDGEEILRLCDLMRGFDGIVEELAQNFPRLDEDWKSYINSDDSNSKLYVIWTRLEQ